MPRMLFAVAAVLAAFVVGRATSPAAATPAPKVIVKTEKSVERVACPESEWKAEAIDPDAPTDDEDPDAIDADQTDAVRMLEEESRRVAALETTLGSRGALRGVVTDRATGERLAGVTIVATTRGSNDTLVVITDENGAYEMTGLPAGDYLVTFYYLDTTVEYSNVAVAEHKVTPLFGRLEIKPQPPLVPRIEEEGITITDDYVTNIHVEHAFEDPDAPQGEVTFSGETTLE